MDLKPPHLVIVLRNANSVPPLHGEDSEEQAHHHEDASPGCPSPLASMFMVVPFKVDHSGGKVHRGDRG